MNREGEWDAVGGEANFTPWMSMEVALTWYTVNVQAGDGRVVCMEGTQGNQAWVGNQMALLVLKGRDMIVRL